MINHILHIHQSFRLVICITLLCTLSTSVVAQRDILSSDDELGIRRKDDLNGFDSLQIGKDPNVVDSTIFKYFTLQDISNLQEFGDTTLDQNLSYSDPARDPSKPSANLGTVASASHPLLYTPSQVTGFHSGFHEYDTYNFTIDGFKYYKTNRAISDLYFSTIGNLQNLSLKTDFTRNFEDGIQLSINYQRFSNLGFYSDQRARTTNFGTGLWFQSPTDKYNLFFTFVSNVNTEEQNGGITTDTLFGTEFAEFRTAIPTNLTDANTRYQQRGIRFSNYYKLASPDSTNWNLQLQYDLEYDWNYWNYDDVLTNSSTDTLLYQKYLTDTRGARTYITDNNLSQAAYLHGIGPNGYQGKLGLQYDRHKISQANRDSTINDLSLKYNVSIPFVKSLQLYSKGSIGLGANAGSFDLDGYVNLKIEDWAILKGGANLFRRSIELIEDEFWINDVKIFDNNFSKPFGSKLYGTLNIPKLNTIISLKQTLENNPILWDFNALPYQLDEILSTTQLNAQIHLTWGGWHMDNYLQYQILSEDLIDLPNYMSTHKFYWDGDLFRKNMNLRIGVQTRLVPEYTAQRFIPVIGRFHEGVNPLQFYPDTDFFISFKVQSFRMFLQVQNITEFWSSDKEINYQVENHPQYDFTFRYGIRWVLFD